MNPHPLPPDEVPGPPAGMDDAPAWTVSTAAFRLAPAARWLSPAERAAVAARSRFYRMPWLVPAGTNAADPDPLFC